MRCPKCHYVGFEAGRRCRNCGYDFSLANDPEDNDPEAADELPIAGGDEAGAPIGELTLEAIGPPEDDPDEEDVASDGDAGLGIADEDLPLFFESAAELDTAGRAVTPRPPLSVRRATPEVSRLRSSYAPTRGQEPPVSRSAGAIGDLDTQIDTAAGDRSSPSGGEDRGRRPTPSAPVGRRLLAGLLDLGVLGAIDAGVVYLTLQATGPVGGGIEILPLPPLGAFLAALNGGYFVVFTAAGGQTIGKMATGIKVVGPHGGDVRLPTALARTAAYLVSLLPLGLGFAPALLGGAWATAHDRLADTSVIKIT